MAVFVRSAPDGLRYLLLEEQIVTTAAAWTEHEAAQHSAWVASLNAQGIIAGDYTIDVVGESHYQGALQAEAGALTDQGVAEPEVVAQLVPEVGNRYDPNAVAVAIGGRTVGYLSREDAEEFQPRLIDLARRGHPLACLAELTGGFMSGRRRASIGVVLHLVEPEELP